MPWSRNARPSASARAASSEASDGREFGEDALVRSANVALRVEHLVERLRVAAEAVVAVEDPVVRVSATLLRDDRAASAGSVLQAHP